MAAAEVPTPEPAFRLGDSHPLAPAAPDRSMLVHLSRRVAARPADLLSHVRRALLGHALGDGEETFAALVDLYIATGGKGAPLKEDLLHRCMSLLSPLQQHFLLKHRATGLPATVAIDSALTVLTAGAGQGTLLVECG